MRVPYTLNRHLLPTRKREKGWFMNQNAVHSVYQVLIIILLEPSLSLYAHIKESHIFKIQPFGTS